MMRKLLFSLALVTLAALCGSKAAAQTQQQAGVGVSLDIEPVHMRQASQNAPFTASVKFLCGTIPHGPHPQAPPATSPLVPGTYLTAINIHNHNTTSFTAGGNVEWTKRAIIANPQGKPRGRIGPIVRENLRALQALEVDCLNIKQLLFGPNSKFHPGEPFFKGFVFISSPAEFTIDGVYTLKNVIGFGEPPRQ